MAWTKVQEVSGATSAAAASPAVTVPAPVKGNLLVLVVHAIDDGNPSGNIVNGNQRITSVSQTNVTWTQATSGQVGFNNFKTTQVWRGVAGAASGTTVTINTANDDTVGSNVAWDYTEWSGNTATPFDTAAPSTGSSTTPTTASIVTAQASELIVAGEGNGSGPSLTASGWTALTTATSSGGGFTAILASAYRTAGAAGESEQCTWSAATAQYAAAIAAFEPVPPPAVPAGTVWTFQQG